MTDARFSLNTLADEAFARGIVTEEHIEEFVRDGKAANKFHFSAILSCVANLVGVELSACDLPLQITFKRASDNNIPQWLLLIV